MKASNILTTRSNLVVFEGPDASGKSSVSRSFYEELRGCGCESIHLAFPGRLPGSLGKHIYRLHHNPSDYEIQTIDPAALQTLHIAAHIDAIIAKILPALSSGITVVLDRYWWSTIVYGKAAGIDDRLLLEMKSLELAAWRGVRPTILFLLEREKPLKKEPIRPWRRLCKLYKELATEESAQYPVKMLDNNLSQPTCVEDAIKIFRSVLGPLDAGSLRRRAGSGLGLSVFSSLLPAKQTIVYDSYWRFAAERQEIFFKRIDGSAPPWTEDSILLEYKFTNAYRASDRVSQFLIRNVIYSGDRRPQEVIFRILLFKIFNKIETWMLLKENMGEILYENFDFHKCDHILTSAMRRGVKIFSGAYIMPSGGRRVQVSRKHQAYLKLLQRMMEEDLASRVAGMRGMREAFEALRGYPMIGDFLAYQFVTDINYSEVTDFSEMEFVIPGPGAIDGVRKCFSSFGGLSERDIIKVVADRQEDEFSRLGISFKSLWGRPLQLIDCQNLFCEVDKYARVKHPTVNGISGRKRIKQRFVQNEERIQYWYPPKWGINNSNSKKER